MLSFVENRENIFENRFRKERECTNFPFLVLCAGLMAITLILFGCCVIIGNHERHLKIFDDCGNFCGKLNDDNPIECGSKDLRHLPFLHIEYELADFDNLTIKSSRKCVESCPKNFSTIHNKCKDSNKTEDDDEQFVDAKTLEIILTTEFSRTISIFLQNVTTFRDSIAIMCLFALFFSYIFVILFRFIACYVIWILSIGFIVFVFAIAGVSVVLWNSEVTLAVMAVGTALTGFLFWFRRKISLVAKLFKESSNVMVDMPTIIFGPVLTFTALIISFKLFLTMTSIIHNSGELHRKLNDNGTVIIYFQELKLSVTTHIFNIITFLWFTQFILSCQHFMLCGTITKWYFIRDKEKLEVEKPVKTTFNYLLDFNLGSLCFGSLAIPVVKLVRMIFRPFRKPASESKDFPVSVSNCFCTRPVSSFVELLHYPSRSAYIIVTKEGSPLLEAGKRVFQLQSRNIMDILILSDYGAVVLFIGKIVVVLGAGTFGYEILAMTTPDAYLAIPLIIGAILAFFIAHSFLSFYEMMVDCILVCFCIDCEDNDGIFSPYHMPDNLKKIVMAMKEETGGRLTFSHRNDSGFADGSDIPMLSKCSRN